LIEAGGVVQRHRGLPSGLVFQPLSSRGEFHRWNLARKQQLKCRLRSQSKCHAAKDLHFST
jgi:hypothetical protein